MAGDATTGDARADLAWIAGVMAAGVLAMSLDATAATPQAAAAGATPPAAVADRGPVIYPASFFATFQPQTVLDMVVRTPGFVLQAPDDDDLQRGFAANAGNVLIGGQRPSVKSGGLAAYLARIAASRVERIEILRGALSGEAQGQTMVANVVLRAGSHRSGNASVELRKVPDAVVTPRVEASYATAAGNWQLAAGGIVVFEKNPFGGAYARFDPDHVLIDRFDEALAQDYTATTFTVTAAHPLAGGLLTLNGRVEYARDRYQQRLADLQMSSDVDIDGRDTDVDGEAGADWVRQLGRDWTSKVVALGRTSRAAFAESADEAIASAFDQRSRTTELVGRVRVARERQQVLRPEVIAEVAWNRLTSRLRFEEDGTAVALPGADTRVAELRGDLTLNLSAQVTSTARIDGGIGYEWSDIGVTGDVRAARRLGYWKPAAAVVWDASPATQIRIGWRRTVSQLDFGHFAATGNLIDDRPIAGNAELRPEVSDVGSLHADRRFGSGGAVLLALARESIADALAYVPLTSGTEAMLNAGTVSLWRVSGETTLPLDGVITGARITATGRVTSARRRDPVTGQQRDDSRDGMAGTLAFRHDISAWRAAYGVELHATSPERTWFVAQYEETRYRPYLSAYLETAIVPGFKTTVTVWGLAGERQQRARSFYLPDRAGELSGVERRVRGRDAHAAILLARQF